MLPASLRRAVAEHLEPEEIKAAGSAYENEYRRLSSAARTATARQLQRVLSTKHSPVPLLISLALGVMTVGLASAHYLALPAMSLRTRGAILTPLFLTTVAPLALYLLPRYRLSLVFRPVLNLRATGSALLAFLVLLWSLYFIGREQGGNLQLDTFSQLLFLLGAIGAPLLEEIIFREFVPASFGRSPHLFGHLLAAVVFALIHIPATPGMFALYFIAAVALAEVRIQSDGILYCYLAHAAANLTILLAIG